MGSYGKTHDTRKKSLLETLVDVGLGLVVSTILNFTVLPMYVDGIISSDWGVMVQISIWYTDFAIYGYVITTSNCGGNSF